MLVILVCVVEEIYFWRLFTDWIAPPGASGGRQLRPLLPSAGRKAVAKKYGEHLLDSLDSDGQDREYD